MDSMRSLNTSLPGATPSKIPAEHPEQLLSAFKAAALAVTNLYKGAAANQGRARAEGYQDALDELLAFLDKQDIGLSDGEGWRVRRWATERLDGRASASMESDDEVSDKQERGSSPILQRSQSATRLPTPSNPVRTASPVRPEAQAPPTIVTPTSEESTFNMLPPQGNFSFRSSHPYPQDADIILSDLDISDSNRPQSHDSSASTNNTGITITRQPRGRNNNNNSSRLVTRTSSSIGRGAGTKRKINFGEFFDIGNLHKDGNGGGGGAKRGRHI